MVSDKTQHRPIEPEASQLVGYLLEHPLAEIRTGFMSLPLHERRSATSLAILFLLLDLPDAERALILFMLRSIYFQSPPQ